MFKFRIVINVSITVLDLKIFGGNKIDVEGGEDQFGNEALAISFKPTGDYAGVYHNVNDPFGNTPDKRMVQPTSNFTFNATGGNELRVSGDIIAFASSDQRLKNNIKPILNPIDKILKIGGYTFNWNEKQNMYKGQDVGVIAQEIEKIIPSAVKDREDDAMEGYKSVKYEKIIPLLIEGIKEQQKQINELKKIIKKIK